MQRRSVSRSAITSNPMHNDLTDLLPLERRAALLRGYVMRLAVVAVWFVTALAVVSAVLLVPTYVFLSESVRSKEAHLASIESTLSVTNETALSSRLSTLSHNAEALIALSDAPSVSTIVRSILALSRPGITLSGFSYTPAEEKTPGVVKLSGTALTRAALRSYQLALSGSALVLSADLPVSAYAKDVDIDFAINVTLVP